MAKITVVTLSLEGSDQTIMDGLKSIGETIQNVVLQRGIPPPAVEAAALIAPALPSPDVPVERRRGGRIPKAARLIEGGKKKGPSPLAAAIERLLAKRSHTADELRDLLADEGLDVTMMAVAKTLGNLRVRSRAKKGPGKVWSLAL